MYECFYTRKRSGFTLLELLLVIAITFTIGLLASPFYSRFYTQNSVDTTTSQLLNSLRKAQFYTMMGKDDSKWGVHYSTSTIYLYRGNTYTGTNAVDTFSVNNSITISGFTDINFIRVTGLPTSGVPSSTPTIVINGNNTSRTITVNAQGVASL